MPVQNYGVWRAKPLRYTYEDRHQDPRSPHIKLYFADNDAGEGEAAINIKSGDTHESRLAYWAAPRFIHPITEELAALNDGVYGFQLLAGTSEQGPGGLALDFIRGNLFDRNSGRILPHDVAGPDNDILDEVRPIIDRAISTDATVYIYGSHFNDGKGIHDIHMNQGNAQSWAKDNGVYQDGAVIFQFGDHWEAVFIGFASQAIHTEDGGDDAGQPIPRTDYMTWANFLPEVASENRARDDLADSPVFISEAQVSPGGPSNNAPQTVTLTERANQAMNLAGWKIVNRAGQAQNLSGLRLAAGGSVTVKMTHAPLPSRGGTITLLNEQGLKVHGVSYTRAQARNGTIIFQ